MFGQRPPSAFPVHDDRHLGDQIVLKLAEHQVVLHLVARRNAIADVVEVVEQVVRQVHVRDALFGDARQLGLVVRSTAATDAHGPAAAADATAATAAAATAAQEPTAATAAAATDQSDALRVQRRFHDHHFLGLDGERQLPPLRARVGHAQLLGAGLVVLVPGHVPPVQIDEEHRQTAEQHASRAEVIAGLGAVTDVNVTCESFVKFNR